MEQRKFLRLTKYSTGKCILIPIDNIITIEEQEVIEKNTNNIIVKVGFQSFNDIRYVFVKESIKDITQGFVFTIL
ncbi:MAG: hypothetical protein LIR50_10080 [Bacillota bacterium]|nr:hypothetical protein [Bacillota bacterium]